MVCVVAGSVQGGDEVSFSWNGSVLYWTTLSMLSMGGFMVDMNVGLQLLPSFLLGIGLLVWMTLKKKLSPLDPLSYAKVFGLDDDIGDGRLQWWSSLFMVNDQRSMMWSRGRNTTSIMCW
jgi:hypothetical protein